MRKHRVKRFSLTLILVSLTGCLPASDAMPNASSETLKSTAPKTKRVPNPDFLSWDAYPVETQIVRRNTIHNEIGDVVVTNTLRLARKSDSVIKIESQISVKRPNDFTENPPQELEYSREQSVLEATTDEQIAAPIRDAELLGQEKITVLGKEYSSYVYRWQTALESGPADVKGWFSDEFPGRQIRLELDFGDSQGVEEIIELKTP